MGAPVYFGVLCRVPPRANRLDLKVPACASLVARVGIHRREWPMTERKNVVPKMEKPVKSAKLPRMDSIHELAEFWDTHDLTDFEEELEEVKERVFIMEPTWKQADVFPMKKCCACLKKRPRKRAVRVGWRQRWPRLRRARQVQLLILWNALSADCQATCRIGPANMTNTWAALDGMICASYGASDWVRAFERSKIARVRAYKPAAAR